MACGIEPWDSMMNPKKAGSANGDSGSPVKVSALNKKREADISIKVTLLKTAAASTVACERKAKIPVYESSGLYSDEAATKPSADILCDIVLQPEGKFRLKLNAYAMIVINEKDAKSRGGSYKHFSVSYEIVDDDSSEKTKIDSNFQEIQSRDIELKSAMGTFNSKESNEENAEIRKTLKIEYEITDK